MKVLNLQCDLQHGFEGWFDSEEDFQTQLTKLQVHCPMCGSAQVQKLPSAPRLNLSSASNPSDQNVVTQHQPDVRMDVTTVQGVQAQLLQAMRQLLASTEDVGASFPEEARKMHYGESQARHIRGQATLQETSQLLEEGIDVLPLPMAEALKSTLQ